MISRLAIRDNQLVDASREFLADPVDRTRHFVFVVGVATTSSTRTLALAFFGDEPAFRAVAVLLNSAATKHKKKTNRFIAMCPIRG